MVFLTSIAALLAVGITSSHGTFLIGTYPPNGYQLPLVPPFNPSAYRSQQPQSQWNWNQPYQQQQWNWNQPYQPNSYQQPQQWNWNQQQQQPQQWNWNQQLEQLKQQQWQWDQQQQQQQWQWDKQQQQPPQQAPKHPQPKPQHPVPKHQQVPEPTPGRRDLDQCKYHAQPHGYDPVCVTLEDGSTKDFSHPWLLKIERECDTVTKYTDKVTKGKCSAEPKHSQQQPPHQAPKHQHPQPAHQGPAHQQQPQPGRQPGRRDLDKCNIHAQPHGYDPVCVYLEDGTTKEFSHPWLLKIERECDTVTKYTDKETKGECPKAAAAPAPRKDPASCKAGRAVPQIYSPVCAYMADGTKKTYGNQYELDIDIECEPEKHTDVKDRGRCAEKDAQPTPTRKPQATPSQGSPEECMSRMGCAMNYDPICVVLTDGTTKTFSNSGCFNVENSCYPGKFTHKSTKGRCEAPKPTVRSQEEEQCRRRPIPQSLSPVCAEMADGTKESFDNQWIYKMEKECGPKKFSEKEPTQGRCINQPARQVTGEECMAGKACSRNYDPICATLTNGKKDTYPNDSCFLLEHQCYPGRFAGNPTKGACQ